MSFYRQGPSRPSGHNIGIPALTPYVKAMMITCAVVWLCQMALARGFQINLSMMFGVVPLRVATGWVWQPLTYMFLHSPGDPFHLLFNMLMLWMFGGELERYWGSKAFLTYYVVCGVGGGIAATLLGLAVGGEGAALPTIGASGAIFGLFAAYGVVFAKRTVLFMLIFPMQARTMSLLLVGLSFFYLLSQPGSPVSHIGHLGGALTGYLYLKRAWRMGEFYRELRWKIRRRKFKMMPPKDSDDHWIN